MSPSHKRILRLLTKLALAYAILVAALLALEPTTVYQPSRSAPSTPEASGLEGYVQKTLPRADGSTLMYWESKAASGRPPLLYFHGNGGGLYYHAPALAFLEKHGFHVLALEYPSYPGAPGKPTESGIVGDAVALFDHAKTQTGKTPIVWGFSLGSGIAAQLSTQRQPSAFILEAPFTAVDDRAAELFPFIPTRLLMRNTYRTHEVIGRIAAPILILHGTEDEIIPIHHGRALAALAREPKEFLEYPGFHHLDLIESSAYRDAVGWLETTVR